MYLVFLPLPLPSREPAHGIPAPATVLINTGHRQRMQRLHQQGPQPRNRRGQVPAHPPGHTGRPEKAIIRGIFRHTRHIRSRRALNETGRGRMQISRHSGAPDKRPGHPGPRVLTADTRTERHPRPNQPAPSVFTASSHLRHCPIEHVRARRRSSADLSTNTDRRR